MSLHYLMKLNVRVLKVNSNWKCEPKKHTNCFCHNVYKTSPSLLKVCTYCPEYICHRLL